METAATRVAPIAVRRAVSLLWASTALVVVAIAAMWTGLLTRPGDPQSTVVDTATNLLTFGLLALIAWKISQGRNWARWVLAIVVFLGVLSAVFSLLVVPELWLSMSFLFIGLGLLQTVLQVLALVLAFSSEARPWFRRQDAAV
jgi:peptidoglycan/LPS O-acetylase OafA/YrhL